MHNVGVRTVCNTRPLTYAVRFVKNEAQNLMSELLDCPEPPYSRVSHEKLRIYNNDSIFPIFNILKIEGKRARGHEDYLPE